MFEECYMTGVLKAYEELALIKGYEKEYTYHKGLYLSHVGVGVRTHDGYNGSKTKVDSLSRSWHCTEE